MVQSIRGNNIPISGPLLLEELANLLTHLTATLSRHQTDGLEDRMRGTSRLPLYTFLRLKIQNKDWSTFGEILSMIHKYCKASQTNNLLNILCQLFQNHRHFYEK